MTRILALLIAVLCFGIGPPKALAEGLPYSMELQGLIGVGGPMFLALGPNYDQMSSRPVAVIAAARVRNEKVFVGLEMNLVAPVGMGMNMLFDVYRGDRFRVHIIDPGVFWNVRQPLSVARVARTYDVTVGFGGEIFLDLRRRVSLTVDWRVYLPDPYGILTQFGGFARPIYKEAAQGGYVWVGFAYRY